MLLPRLVLWLDVLAFAGFGLAFVLYPRTLATLVDLQLTTPTARVDFVSTYGGFELGFALFLALCTRRDDRVSLGLLAAALCLGGFAAVRLIGLVALDGLRPIVHLLLALELVGVTISLWAARRAAGSAHPPIRSTAETPRR